MPNCVWNPVCVVVPLLLLAPISRAAVGTTNLPSCKRPAPPPGPPGPHPPPGPPGSHPNPAGYKSKVELAIGVMLYYNVNMLEKSASPTISFLLNLKQEATAATSKTIGWLALGLSPTGAMKDGSFVFGYDGCVRVTSLSGPQTDRPPNGKAGFDISGESFSRDGDGAWLAFERGLKDSLPGHISIDGESTLNFLYAAGTTAPDSGHCTEELEMSNIHDIAHGSKAVPPGTLDLMADHAESPVSFAKYGSERILRTELHPTTGRAYAVTEQAFFSSPMFLKNGEVAWTDMQKTVIPMPTGGDYAVLSMRGEVVDCNNVSVPLTTVYNHHWVMRPIAGPTKFDDSACPDESFSYVFGVGAESRETYTAFPPGYGYVVQKGTVWGVNIHLLHTQGLVGGQQGIKECIECWATPFRQKNGCNPARNGSFACCGLGRDSGTCQTTTLDPIPTEYYLKMYVTFTHDIETITPLDIAVFRAPNCLYEYNVGDRPSVQMGDVNMVEDQWVIKQAQEVEFAVGHLHTGAINVTASVRKAGSQHFEPVCASYPVYGTNGTTPGNESGHVVKVTYCLSSDGNDGGIPSQLQGAFRNSSLVLEEDDTFKIQGYYATGATDPRIYPVPAGPHLGVMSFMYVAFKTNNSSPASDSCVAAMARDGCSPDDGVILCDACAGRHQSDLRAAKCTSTAVKAFCAGSVPQKFQLVSTVA